VAGAPEAEGLTVGADQELDFYDELEHRPLVSFDDVLHAVLLLTSGRSAEGYGARLELARRSGWIDESFDHAGRDVATTGEVAEILADALGVPGDRGGARSGAGGDWAIRRLAVLGVLPASARPEHGLTGAQMLAILRNAQDILPGRAGGRADLADRSTSRDAYAQRESGGGTQEETFDDFGGFGALASEESSASDARNEAASSAADAGGDLGARPVPRAMPEPLPELPVRPIRKADGRDAGGAPPRDARHDTAAPAEPKGERGVPAPRSSRWIRGTPLKRPVK
jgi:hypothetical protein